jgi:hypothetical protein
MGAKSIPAGFLVEKWKKVYKKEKKYTCGLTDNINPVLAYFKALPC